MLRRFLKAILRNWTIRFLNATNEISHLLRRWVRRWCWSDLCWVGDFVRCLSGRLRRGGKSPPTTGTTRRPAIKQPFRTTFRQNILETTPMNTPYEYLHRNWTNRFKKNTQQVKHLWTEIRIEIGYQVIRFDFTITSMMLIWFHHTSKLSSMEKSLTGKQWFQQHKWKNDLEIQRPFALANCFELNAWRPGILVVISVKTPPFLATCRTFVRLENWFFTFDFLSFHKIRYSWF